jgi:hypothetical protein
VPHGLHGLQDNGRITVGFDPDEWDEWKKWSKRAERG